MYYLYKLLSTKKKCTFHLEKEGTYKKMYLFWEK